MANNKVDTSSGSRQALWTLPFLEIIFTDLIIFASAQMLRPVIPLYVVSMGGNKLLVGIVASAFVFTAVILRPLSGLAVDRLGRKTVLLASLGTVRRCRSHFAPGTSYTWIDRGACLTRHRMEWGATGDQHNYVGNDTGIAPWRRAGIHEYDT